MKKPAKVEEVVEEPEPEEAEEEEAEVDQEVETPRLTKEVLKNHTKFCQIAKNMTEKDFLQALQKLDSNAAMRLWKEFQKSRKVEGQEEEYNNAVKDGTGSLAKKRKLLYGWVMSDKTCGEQYREYMLKVNFVKTSGVKEKWPTSQQALATWGKDELWARVKAGTIAARKCPQDTRFWEFKNLQQVGQTMAHQERSTSAHHSGKLDQQVALQYEKLELGQIMEDDWNVHEEEEEDAENDNTELAKALGIKVKPPGEDKAKGAVKDWETASKISAADSKSVILDKVMKFKAELEKDKSQLDSKEYEAKKAGVKDSGLYKDKKEAAAKLEATSEANSKFLNS